MLMDDQACRVQSESVVSLVKKETLVCRALKVVAEYQLNNLVDNNRFCLFLGPPGVKGDRGQPGLPGANGLAGLKGNNSPYGD